MITLEFATYVKQGEISSIFDLKEGVKKYIGEKIEIGFFPEFPNEEKSYTLINAEVGIDLRGAYIHFYLQSGEAVTEFIINGIKNYEYEIQPGMLKYLIFTSDEVLKAIDRNQLTVRPQTGKKVYRFFISKDNVDIPVHPRHNMKSQLF